MLRAVKKRAELIDRRRTGRAARAERLRAGLTLRQVAEAMGLWVQVLSDLENGKRRWSRELVARFNAALKARKR